MFSLPPLTRGCLINIGIEGHTASKLFYMKKHSEASPFAHFTSESLFAQTANQMAEFSALALRVSCEQEFFFEHSLNRRIGHHAALLSASIRPVTRSCKKQFSATSGFSAASPASGCRSEPQKTLFHFAVSREVSPCHAWSYRAWTRKNRAHPFKAPETEQLSCRAWARKGSPPLFKAQRRSNGPTTRGREKTGQFSEEPPCCNQTHKKQESCVNH